MQEFEAIRDDDFANLSHVKIWPRKYLERSGRGNPPDFQIENWVENAYKEGWNARGTRVDELNQKLKPNPQINRSIKELLSGIFPNQDIEKIVSYFQEANQEKKV